MKFNNTFLTYIILFILSIFSIFFLWTNFNEETWSDEFAFKFTWFKDFKKWLDIAWWARLTYRIDYSRYEEVYTDTAQLADIKKSVEWIILSNIDKRISTLWVSDYSSYIQTIWQNNFVVVEIWWVSDINTAKDIIWRTVELEFKVPYEWTNPEWIKQSRQILAENILFQLINDEVSFIEIFENNLDNDFSIEQISNNYDDLPEFIKENFEWIVSSWTWNVYPSLLPNSDYDAWHIVSWLWNDDEKSNFIVLTIYFFPTWITAIDPATWQILNAAFFNYATSDSSQSWQPVVLINFNSAWWQIFCNLTSWHVWKQMAIFVWWQLMTAPVIQEQICWWTAQISWNFSREETRILANDLNEWAMPAPLILSHEEMVSPTLWDAVMKASLFAALIWFIAIFIFMFIVYWVRKWIVSILTLIFFVSFLFALIKILWYALSLSWIAAIILSIWIAVDANVLIFERVREELKSWKSASQAIRDWFDRSLSAIRDWNLTTWLIWLLLFMVWTNVFKWFWTMMIVNVILILIVVVPLTKIFLFLLYNNYKENAN